MGLVNHICVVRKTKIFREMQFSVIKSFSKKLKANEVPSLFTTSIFNITKVDPCKYKIT